MVQGMPARPKRPKPRAIVRPDLALRARARKILTRLAKAYPDWGPTLDFSSPLELLVATILAAQAQDERINEVTRVLFTKYRGPEDYAAAPAGVLERDVEASLRTIYPKKDWIRVTWCFVLHGRRVCRPTPLCPICPIIDLCPYPKKTKTLPAALRSNQQGQREPGPARRPR